MNSKQALELLIQATAQLNANREVHLQILKAIEVLKKELENGNS